MKTAFVAVAAFAASVLGHGLVETFTTDGKQNKGFILDYYYQKQNGGKLPDIAAWYAENLDIGFVAPGQYSSPDINCHKNAAPGSATATVAAGGTVTFKWGPTAWPHPYGPILGYAAPCNGDCSKVVKTDLKWTKIQEEGIDYKSQVWAQQKMISQGNTWSMTVPKDLKAGNYVFRHELIALHGATSVGGAQNYPQCFNIAVTGSGTKTLPAGTSGTSLYNQNHPGIVFNPYTTITNYPMPGPALWTG